jgi:putative transposase
VPNDAKAPVLGFELAARREDYPTSSQTKQVAIKHGGNEKGRRHSDEQIRAILLQFEAGLSSAVLCAQHGISRRTLYRWRCRLNNERGGSTTLDLQQENRTLRGLIVDLTLENQILKNMFHKR